MMWNGEMFRAGIFAAIATVVHHKNTFQTLCVFRNFKVFSHVENKMFSRFRSICLAAPFFEKIP